MNWLAGWNLQYFPFIRLGNNKNVPFVLYGVLRLLLFQSSPPPLYSLHFIIFSSYSVSIRTHTRPRALRLHQHQHAHQCGFRRERGKTYVRRARDFSLKISRF